MDELSKALRSKITFLYSCFGRVDLIKGSVPSLVERESMLFLNRCIITRSWGGVTKGRRSKGDVH